MSLRDVQNLAFPAYCQLHCLLTTVGRRESEGTGTCLFLSFENISSETRPDEEIESETKMATVKLIFIDKEKENNCSIKSFHKRLKSVVRNRYELNEKSAQEASPRASQTLLSCLSNAALVPLKRFSRSSQTLLSCLSNASRVLSQRTLSMVHFLIKLEKFGILL